MSSTSETKWVMLECPGKKVPIRQEPNVTAEVLRYASSGDMLEVHVKTTSGFFRLTEKKGFINKATKGVEWMDVPIEVEQQQGEVDETIHVVDEEEQQQQQIEQQAISETYQQSEEYQEPGQQFESYQAPSESEIQNEYTNEIYEPPPPIIQSPTAIIPSPPSSARSTDSLAATSAKMAINSKLGGSPKCAVCTKAVYPAEKVQAIDRIWHKTCFCCGGSSQDGGCGKVLTLDKYLSHGEDPFCKACHGRLFGPKGFGFSLTGGAMTTLEPSMTPQESSSTPRYSEDNTTVSALGQMANGGSDNSSPRPPPPPSSSRPSMSPRSASVQEYSYSSNNNTSNNNSNNTSPRPAFKTAASESDASQYTYNSPNSSATKPSLASRIGEGAPKCAVCIKAVYPAEKVQAINRIWHKTCFCCGGNSQDGGCGKVLTLDKYLSHGEDPFCKACHGRLFGPKGFGFSITGSAMTLEPSTPRISSAHNSSKSLAETLSSEQDDYNNDEHHHQQSNQDDTQPYSTATTNSTPVSSPQQEKIMASSYISPTKTTADVNNTTTTTPVKSSPLASRFGGAAPKCALCVQSVYPAEKTQAINRIWHKTCFKCGGSSQDGGCGKVLTLDKYLSHGEDPFCKACHGKLFAPKGFGYGGAMAHHIPVDN